MGHGKLLRASQVAEWLGISRSSLYQMAEEGRIPCVRFPRTSPQSRGAVRFDPDEIECWVNRHRHGDKNGK